MTARLTGETAPNALALLVHKWSEYRPVLSDVAWPDQFWLSAAERLDFHEGNVVAALSVHKRLCKCRSCQLLREAAVQEPALG